MSFSAQTKEELARITPEKRCCQLAELAALFRMDGALQLSRSGVSLTLTTESASVARKIFRLVKQIFDIHTEIVVQRKRRLKKNNVYSVTIPSQKDGVSFLEALGLVDGEGHFTYEMKDSLPTKDCDRRAYLRGAFLGGGSVNNPEGTYHLEIIVSDEAHAEALAALINQFGLQAKISQRKNWYVVYLKESEQIVDFLSIIGAHTALLNFENVRIVKGMRNQVNRLVNCETANLNKTVNASVRQVENIHLIQERMGLDKLPPALKEMAELRLQYPDSSLKELGEMLSPPVGKSGVNHRLRKLEELADQLRSR